MFVAMAVWTQLPARDRRSSSWACSFVLSAAAILLIAAIAL
jgi:hypothetical protein